MRVARVCGIEREEGDRMLARQFPKYVVAADFPTGVGRDQPAGFNPEDLHGGSSLPANPFVVT